MNPFEYVSILVSIILGLGIAQILSSFSDLLYDFKKVQFYWPHTIWVVFILYLHIQDWFITFKLRYLEIWSLPQITFVLLYPICLFLIAKMLLPTNLAEERFSMKKFYETQYPVIFALLTISIFVSIVFNIMFLEKTIIDQILLFLFLALMLFMTVAKNLKSWMHKGLALLLLTVSITSIFVEHKLGK